MRNLSLKDCSITKKHLEALGEAIVLLSHIDLSSNNLTVMDCEFLTNLVCSSFPRQILTISLNKCHIGDMHLEVMADMIANLRCVSLSDNPQITSDGLSKLSNSFLTNPNIVLETLYLENCNLTTHHLMALKDVLTKIKKSCIKKRLYLMH